MLKKSIILFIFLLPCFLFSQEIGKIYSINYPADTVVNYGPCYIGDSLSETFRIENLTNDNFIIYEVMPTFGILRDPNETFIDEFRSYKNVAPLFPINLAAQSKTTLIIQYNASTDLFTSPLGWYHSILQVGFSEVSDTNLVYGKKFYLRAKKTNKAIDGYEDLLNFDSIYINSTVKESIIWRVKSVLKDSISLVDQKFILLSPQLTTDEFISHFYSINPVFRYKGEALTWQFEYAPLDMGVDSGRVELAYKPFVDTYPDSIQKASCKLQGVGVKQDIRLNYANYDFRNDTIFLGNIQSSKLLKINAQIKNYGNIPFNSIDEQITAENLNITSQILKKIKDNPASINQNGTGEFSFEIKINNIGDFVFRYEITSDISQRNIKFAPASANKIVFYIVGKAIEPLIAVSSILIQFPTIYQYLPYCESTSDTTLYIHNLGNDTLRINQILIENDIPEFTFTTDKTDLSIPPKSKDSILIIFSPILTKLFTADLLLISNSENQIDTVKIGLMGSSVAPSATSISIGDYKGKPGSIIEIPIMVDSNIVFSSNFSDTIYYNRSILQYVGYKNQGTASQEPIENISIKEDSSGYLAIYVKKPTTTRFYENKILIKLQFKIYLGNSPSTLISFLNPRFGNQYCDYALRIPKENIKNGYFEIDSVGGIDMKAYPIVKPAIQIESLSPNPVKDKIDIKLWSEDETFLKLAIYDYYGNMIMQNDFGIIEAGDYYISQDFAIEPTGMYLIVLYSNYEPIYQRIIKY
ncbi:MAG: hypothetical protein KBA52_02320 [Candidatus Kapabacteria bacterium]|nr:hypothetical protein [Candidatus Kapabacteria bacterium]